MSSGRPRRASQLVALVVAAVVVATVWSPVAGVPAVPDEPVAAPVPLAAAELSSPALASLDGGRLDMFTRSSGGDLLHQYRPVGGSWTRSLNLGGDLASQPAAVSWTPGRLDVFVRGTDDVLWQKYYCIRG